MNPTACEILVHVTAPSGARDDKRYESIAQAVLDFQPVSKVKVSESNFIFISPASGAAQKRVDSVSDPDSNRYDSRCPGVLSTRRGRCCVSGHKEISSASTSLRTPSTVYSLCSRSPPLVPPEIPRPRTAPAATFPAENPEVASTITRRRAHSQTSSSDRYGLSASESSQRGADYSRIIRPSQLVSFESGRVADQGHARKRPRLAVPENEQAVIAHQSGPRSTDPTTPTKQGHAAPTSTTTRVGTGADSPSVPSTVSPSQPLYWTKVAPAPKSTCSRSQPVIDLTTPARPNRGTIQSTTGRQGTHNDTEVFHVPSKPRQREIRDDQAASHAATRGNNRSTRLGSRISQLPDEVRGPNPKGGQARYRTHLTRTLQKLAVRVPLSKHFRPAFVARDVNVLERGFWQFSVQIVGDDTAAKRTRRLSTDRANTPQWTEKEFIHFWQNVSRFVAEGKAGWGTALVKEPVETAANGNPVWKIRLFTWGEILGHIWLVLWVLSDKSTGRICMHWVAGDGNVVVKMSGAKNRKHAGNHESWVRKGPAKGEGGVWGISEDFC